MNLPQTVSEQQWLTNLRRYGERGYYEAAAYARSANQIDALVGLINKFSEHPTDILIVLMPEHSKLRARIPPAALDTLLRPLTQALGGATPEIVDMRTTVPDSGFTDISHMNSVGRRLFSPLLSGVIATHRSASAQSDN